MLKFIALAVLSLGMACTHAQNSDSTLASYGSTWIPNLHKVNGTSSGSLWRSGRPTGSMFRKLSNLGVTTVVSVEDYGGSKYLADQERKTAVAYGMKFVWIPMSGSKAPSVLQVQTALAAIDAAAYGSTLVHCHLGSDRTGVVVAAYRMTHDSWSEQDAVNEMYQYGHATELSSWDGVLDAFSEGNPAIGDGSGSQADGSGTSVVDAPVVGSAALSSNQNVALGMPLGQESAATVTISRAQYVISWNESTRLLNWAAWRVGKDFLGSVGRQNDFAADADLNDFLASKSAGSAVGPDDFSSSCLDRGHQVPSADRTDSVADNSETFQMSNIIPQTAYLNRGAWAHLETYTRKVSASGGVYVFAGPIFGKNPARVGKGTGVAVPAKNFKIIVRDTGEVLAAVIMPNTTSAGTDPVADKARACADQGHKDVYGNSNDWQAFNSSVAEIEAATGLAFPFLKH